MDIVIGLIGAKGAGKTTAFNALKEIADVQEITLAAKLKDVSAEVFNIPRNHFDSHEFKETEFLNPVFLDPQNLTKVYRSYNIQGSGKDFFDAFIRPHIGKVLLSPRQVAQYVGTEILRAYEGDIHCTSAVEGIEKRVGVVTDMRFPNEFNYFAERYPKFHPVYIQNMAAEITAGGDTHVSEAYLRELSKRAEFTITNNDSVKEFIARVKSTLKGLV